MMRVLIGMMGRKSCWVDGGGCSECEKSSGRKFNIKTGSRRLETRLYGISRKAPLMNVSYCLNESRVCC